MIATTAVLLVIALMAASGCAKADRAGSQTAAVVTNAGLTVGKPVASPFPRMAFWWPNAATPIARLAEFGYLVPYEWQPPEPNATRIAALRSLNPSSVLLADASACELKYRQPDAAGNPQGPDSYDAELVGAIPTSWILTQVGSTLAAPIASVSRPQQSISVADGSRFRPGDLVIIDAEKCLVVSAARESLVVRRAWAGSVATDHPRGTRIASAVSSWPYTVKVDITDACPPGRATGRSATPGPAVQNERARDWMVRRAAAFAGASAGLDGVAVDLSIGYISWFRGSGPNQFRSIARRSDPTREVDYAAFDVAWATAMNTFQTRLRSAVGPNEVIVPNEGTPAFEAVNGSRVEDFPKKTTDSSEWHQKVIGPNRTYFPSYLEWCAKGRQPNFSTIQTYGDSPTDYRLMRFGLTSALMGDGFYAFKVGGTNAVLRYDEFDNAGADRGYLGAPLGEMRSVVPTLTTPDLLGGRGALNTEEAVEAWTLTSRPGFSASKALEGGIARIRVSKSGGLAEGVTLWVPGLAVKAGRHYTLSLRAKADKPMSVRAAVRQAAAPRKSYMTTDAGEIPLTTEWRTFEIPMTSTGSGRSVRFELAMGEAVGTIWVGDVKLQPGDRTAYRRDYQGGVALVNATDQAVTVDLSEPFRRIKGPQAPLINDGSLVTNVTVPARDGLVLIRPAAR